MNEMYQTTLSIMRRNIVENVALSYCHKYFSDITGEYQVDLIKEIFDYLLIKKGDIHKRRREEYTKLYII